VKLHISYFISKNKEFKEEHMTHKSSPTTGHGGALGGEDVQVLLIVDLGTRWD
jgi:hypothetical protein